MSDLSNQPSPSPAQDAAQELDSLESLRAEKEEAERIAAELKDRLLRQAADAENSRRRMQREMEDAEARGREKLLADLLEVVDNLQRALAVAAEDSPLTQGVRMVEKQFLAALAKYQVTPFESVGQPFDPSLHDAIQLLPSSNAPPNTVLEELATGYRHGGRLLRPARVVVSTDAPAAEQSGGTPTE